MESSKFSCVLVGDGSLLTRCGDLLLERGHDIRAVVTSDCEVVSWTTQRGLQHIASDDAFRDGLSGRGYDWLFSIANLRMLPARLWQSAAKGAANFHDGPLPRHAGLNAPAWAILSGESQYGVTWHAITERADEGDIYTQATFDVAEDETSLTLNMKCFEAGFTSFGVLVERIEAGSLTGTPQDLSQRSYHARDARPRALAMLDFSQGTTDILRLSRALTFGERYNNPLCLPKLRIGTQVFNVLALEPAEGVSPAPAGTVLSADSTSIVVATADGAVRITSLTDEAGKAIPLERAVQAGARLPSLTVEQADELDKLAEQLARNEAFFRRRLQDFRDIELDGIEGADESRLAQWQTLDFELPAGLIGERAVAALAGALARLSGQTRIDLFVRRDPVTHPGYVASTVPLSVAMGDSTTGSELALKVTGELDNLKRHIGYAADLASRTPRLAPLRSTVAIALNSGSASPAPCEGSALTFSISADRPAGTLVFDASRVAPHRAGELLRRLRIAMAHFAGHPEAEVMSLPLMDADELYDVLYGRNRTACHYDRSALIHQLVERQVAATPDAVAVVCGEESLTYRELNARANRVAEHLVSLGVAADALAGIRLKRSCDLVVAVLAILKAGGAYVPLDPNYPAERLEYMIEDSGLKVLLVDPGMDATPRPGVQVLTIPAALDAVKIARPSPARAAPDNLAYVIYTSGSTGKPKGVMIEHRNVVNFFAGMDQRIPRSEGEQPVWLAVTSLSFDISVLELLWTLTRGFRVVVLPDHAARTQSAAPRAAQPTRRMDFGLFYWGDDDKPGALKYRLLLEGARFADAHGFTAIWTPERHFHAFGGPYPNPAVTGAAVAAITKNVSVRAGSCVLPLHHPARVAEDWAVVDNLSNGRAAIAFASGWMPEDFILRPENAPPENKKAMFRDIEVVRKLWRGETVAFPAAGEKTVAVTTLPRPIQPELPVWVTTAGNPDTFREAARHGANILTHLLGQSIADVAANIAIYREELRKCGRDPAQFRVTIMLHTLVGTDREVIRSQAREPMKRYLKSAAALIKEYAWAFPAFKRPQGVTKAADLDLRSLDAEELDTVVEFAFLRYFEDSGLFGTVEDALARVRQLSGIGVDEIACLIDFGVSDEVALAGLAPLAEVVAKAGALRVEAPVGDGDSGTLGGLIERHAVTHMQCTPAMATMLLQNDADRAALGKLRHLFIGGEAPQASLLNGLREATQATIENMYGPTETTIWSSTGPTDITEGTVPLGTPIANTQLYILDSRLRPVPPGTSGELVIGGDGVARGYLNRPELTRERFVENPFVPGGRMYRTGDLARIGEDGALHFIGRGDNQVKVRGYRIELGEIENSIGSHPSVAQVVVIVRQDTPGDARIVAYVRFRGEAVSDDELRSHIRKTLPDFMVPAHFVRMDAFPLTPNLKVDRKALPKPGASASGEPSEAYVAPASDLEKQIADVFQRVLGLPRVGLNDNFFSLGGHSLLAVQAHRDLKRQQATSSLSITDLYRFPTVAGLANHLRHANDADNHLDRIAARAASRRSTLASRRAALTQ